MQYFGSNIVEGVAEAEMSWVEVDGSEWRWMHGLVIPQEKNEIQIKKNAENTEQGNTKTKKVLKLLFH